MGETTNQIEAHIESAREELGSNLLELERKVKSVTDWRNYYRSNPMTMFGVAFGGGVLLAAMMSGSRRRYAGRYAGAYTAPAADNGRRGGALQAMDHIKGALIGVAATRVKDFIDDVVPGFNEHYNRAAQQAPARGD